MKKICTLRERYLNYENLYTIILLFIWTVKNKRGSDFLPRLFFLLQLKGFAVGAFAHGGILFVGSHQNPVKRTVVLSAAVIGALLHSAVDTVIGMAAHVVHLLSNGTLYSVWEETSKEIPEYPSKY